MTKPKHYRYRLLLMTASLAMLTATPVAAQKSVVSEAQSKGPAELRAFRLNSADSADLQGLIEKLFGDKVRVATSGVPDSLLIRAEPETLALVENLIEQLEKPKRGSRQLQYALKHAKAADIVDVLSGLLKAAGFEITADERGNTVTIRGVDRESVSMVEKLVKQLDRPSQQDEPQVKIFPLRSRQEPVQMEQLLETATSGSDLQFSIDPYRNIVVAKGDRRSLATLELLLQGLEGVDRDEATDNQAMVRVVWLVSGLDELNASPPEDLKQVVDELAAIGVTDLKLAAQSVMSTISTNVGSVFQAQGRTTLNAPTQLDIEGTVAGLKGDNFVIEISIQANEEAAVPEQSSRFRRVLRSRSLCRLHTTINAPPGHAVVLGVTPIESMNSVFVIQVLPNN